jgi:mycoredoxin
MHQKHRHKLLSQLIPIIFVCAALLIPYHWWRLELLVNPIDNETLKKNDVILYATSWCPYCTKTRLFLRSAQIPFTEFDIEKSPRAYQQYQHINGRGVPVVKIGPNVVQGFDQNAIRQAIDALVSARQ